MKGPRKKKNSDNEWSSAAPTWDNDNTCGAHKMYKYIGKDNRETIKIQTNSILIHMAQCARIVSDPYHTHKLDMRCYGSYGSTYGW